MTTSPSPRKILVVGCGYLGSALARQLHAHGNDVTGWVRSEESAAPLRVEGFSMITGDAAREENWKTIPTAFDAVIHTASSNRGGAEAYRSIYIEAVRQIARHAPRARLIFTSSTSVYAQADGSAVTEESPATPVGETGKILREAEDRALAAHATVLRLAGIYGPGRGVLMARLKNGSAVIEGDGLRWMNSIHRDDAVGAILHSLDHAKPGEIYNVCDDEPVQYLPFYKWAAQKLNKPVPPFGPVKADRKRGVTSKRVSNSKLRSTGWAPLYLTFREGYDACLESL